MLLKKLKRQLIKLKNVLIKAIKRVKVKPLKKQKKPLKKL